MRSITVCLTSLALSCILSIDAEAPVDFAHQIVPILKRHCAKCHTGEKKKGSLSMNSREQLLIGSENGVVVKPRNSAASKLFEVVSTNDPELLMPPKGDRLSPQETQLFKAWIDQGLSWEPGFNFGRTSWDPPLKPRTPVLPTVEGVTNPIDRILGAYQGSHKIEPSDGIDDRAFSRRLHMDVIGLLPAPDALAEFEADTAVGKRQGLIKDVLANDVAYAEHWLTFWNDLLRNDYTGTGFITGGRKQITGWLYESLVNNKPYDKFVHELIAPTAESAGFIQGIKWRGDVNSSQSTEIQFAQNISQVFLGINLKCASCHDSFIDRWKLQECYDLAAVYSNRPLEIHRCDKPTGKMAKPGWLFPELGKITPDAPQPQRMKELAALMTHPENGRLTRTIVNRIWHRLMGRGIVHPVDAMHTEPWSADLLDYLAVHLSESKYDVKKTIELIVSSQAYQSSTLVQKSEPEPGRYVYRGPVTRRMTAEQFMDTVWQITGVNKGRADAKILRGKIESGKEEIPATGKWIWSSDQKVAAKAGERITVRKEFELPDKPAAASATITCDNEYILYVNGTKVGEDKHWPTVEFFPITTALRKGKNTILIVSRNAGSSPNPAALFFEARIGEVEKTVVSTDATWEWTSEVPDHRGRFKKKDIQWKPAVLIATQGFLGTAVATQIQNTLNQSISQSDLFVRASLVKNDFLMRSLGRPHREQVVTTRPSELTTLQAIDLQNGDILANTLKTGAGKLLGRSQDSPDEFATWLFRFSLSRNPTNDELQISRQMLLDAPGQQGVEDLLWAVFMLPEFQLIR